LISMIPIESCYTFFAPIDEIEGSMKKNVYAQYHTGWDNKNSVLGNETQTIFWKNLIGD
jgi:hypothetical protein